MVSGWARISRNIDPVRGVYAVAMTPTNATWGTRRGLDTYRVNDRHIPVTNLLVMRVESPYFINMRGEFPERVSIKGDAVCEGDATAINTLLNLGHGLQPRSE